MDAFYASIEQRDNPELRGKAVAVGHGGKRGVVAAASYEARRYGVRSAMASVTAMRKCPHLIFVKSRFDTYRAISAQIMDIFREYTDDVEPLSLDEAFLDVTRNKKDMPSATLIARQIKRKIKEETGLTASAGVSYNKFLSKIASDYNKPDGLYVIPPEKAAQFIERLPVNRFFGVGKVTAAKMSRLGIKTGYDLKQWKEIDLVRHFGKAGTSYYNFARGIDHREVQADRIRKSLGTEETYSDDLYRPKELQQALATLAQEVEQRAKKKHFRARTLTLKAKYADFDIVTRSKTMSHPITSADEILDLALNLIHEVEDIETRKIRLLGLTLKKTQAELFTASNEPIQLWIDFEENI